MRTMVALSACVLALATTASAQTQMPGASYDVPASVFTYVGPHPSHPAAGGGFCYEAARHTHPFSVDPNLAYLYRVATDAYVFVGNVYEFGYNRQAFPYYNHHPLSSEYGGSYCYLDGAHYHHFVPAAAYGANYIVHNGYYYYNGSYAPAYYSYRTNYYRPYYTYRYLPAYAAYYTSYRTYATTYARPASVSYIYNPPRTLYAAPPRVTAYNAGRPTTVARTYATTGTPVYRYNPNRPTTFHYTRPANAYPATRGPATTPAATPASTATKRVWRR